MLSFLKTCYNYMTIADYVPQINHHWPYLSTKPMEKNRTGQWRGIRSNLVDAKSKRSKKERDAIDTTVAGSLAANMVGKAGSSKSLARTVTAATTR
jgi:hypothetical protein